MTDSENTGDENIIRKENKHGITKHFVPVQVGTKIIECPRWKRNPLTDREHDLTKLSDDGYLKPFLAMDYAMSHDMIDLSSTPVLTFDTDRWELVEEENEESDGTIVVQKRDAESQYGEMVLDE